MDQHNGKTRTAFLLITILCVLFVFVSAFGDDQLQKSFEHDHDQEQEEEKSKASAIEMMKSTFALYTRSPLIPTSYWDKLKTFFNQAQAYFFPPNLEGSKEAEAIKEKSGGEKVEGAIARSLERSKETVEESAKTAAEIAGKSMQKTKDKLKKTLSEEL